MRYAFAGDRDISVSILKFLIESGYKPLALLVTENKKASHADELIKLADIDAQLVFHGNDFKKEDNLKLLKDLSLDYIFGIHFPYIISQEVLEIPSSGFLNLHPAYLPFNKGWHTPSWAIIENTLYGATLHYMSLQLDEGDIIHQKECIILPSDTANSLYQRVKQIEIEVFKEAFPQLLSLKPQRKPQSEKGTSHTKKQLAAQQFLNTDETINVKELINKLRALTTNKAEEAAYFIENNKKYYMQVKITEEDSL